MPKETFHNLSEEKRQLIETVAIDEFAEYGFEKASINRIVEQSQIAKGSFYQYFEGKKDLFLYLLSTLAEKKIKYMSPAFENPEQHDFFTLLRELYITGLKFACGNPKLAKIANVLIKNRDRPIYKEFVGGGVTGMAYDIYESMIKLAIDRGEIRENIDIKYVSYMLFSMNMFNMEYWFEVVENKSIDMSKLNDSILDTVNLFIDFIKHGIGIQKKEGVYND